MTADLQLYSPDPTLTPDQHHVLALLAEGQSLTAAAEAVGVHRNTVRNWRRSVPAFAREIEFAIREQALVWHEASLTLAPKAALVLEEILNDPAASASIRLRAALAVLKMAAEPQPKSLRPFPTVAAEMEAEHGQLLKWKGQVVHNELPKHAQSCTSTPIRKAPEPGRNSICPCGSGLKYKRCCANSAQPVLERAS
jgi:transposase-like protein